MDVSMGYVGLTATNYATANMLLFMRASDDGQLRVRLNEDSGVVLADLRERLRKVIPEKIVPWLEHHLAGEIANRRCARCHQGSSQPRNGRIARKHHHGSSLYFWQLAPPEFAPQRYRCQEAAAPARNAARFPHSSIASIGNSSYAA